VDDILLASNDVHLLLETKGFLSSYFDMKDLGEASYVLGIEIHRDRRKGVFGLSQKSYIETVLKKFNMHKCNPTPAPIVKGVKFGYFQCPRYQYEINEMKAVPYASGVRSSIYAQDFTRPDLGFVTEMLDKYQKNHGKPHWDGVKKALRYLHGTKGLMLTYKKSDAPLEIVGYSDSDFAGCLDPEKLTSGYIFTLINGSISWKNFKQIVSTSSMMYVEFVISYEVTGQAEWFKKFVPKLRVVDSIE
jgi:hypothetical protein